ncbi:MAG TPA: thiamine pyrophosphate-binding protein [Methylococcaceae bacterium]|nr:thiamine pyrophosphate-binding protein [Methylococcaceae bacterium]
MVRKPNRGASASKATARQKPAPRPDRRLADLLVGYLEQLSVAFVFGIPGGAIEGLYNALARSQRRGGPRSIVARHETGAAFMAEGYFRETGKLGVCCTTTGPGATNLITGVANAYENQIPMLVVTAQTALTHFGKDAFQESSCTGINTVGMFQHCTRYNTLVSHADQFEHKLAAAVMAAFRPPAGPVHLSIPKDILDSPVPLDDLRFDLTKMLTSPPQVDIGAIASLSQELAQAKKVVLMIGAGCHKAIGGILQLAQLLPAVVVAAPHGKGLIDAYHPLFRGVIGFGGHSSAREALTDPEVDVILAIGTNLGEWATNGWDSDALLNSRLIHLDDNEEHLRHSPMAKMQVQGHIVTTVQRLLERLNTAPPQRGAGTAPVGAAECPKEPTLAFSLDDEKKYNSDATPITPQRLMQELANLFPLNTRFLADTGNGQAWAIHYLHTPGRRVADRRVAERRTEGRHGPGRRALGTGNFRACLEFVSMGWAIGAAVGTALGCPGAPVVCITGDGSVLMSGQELTVAVQEKLPVIFVVLNDAALGMVKHGQMLGGAERIAFDLPEVDYAACARAMGAEGHVIHSPQDLKNLDIDAICARPGPTLLDVRIDRDEVPPIATRIKVLGETA